MIKQLRTDAKVHLGLRDYRTMPLTRIYEKLQHSAEYKKKRRVKQILKENRGELTKELNGIEDQLQAVLKQSTPVLLKDALLLKIEKLKQVLGIEKRVKNAAIENMSITELDAMPLNSNSF